MDSGDVKKHRNDIFGLLQRLPADRVQALPEMIAADMRAFLRAVASNETFTPRAIGLRLAPLAGLAQLSALYGL